MFIYFLSVYIVASPQTFFSRALLCCCACVTIDCQTIAHAPNTQCTYMTSTLLSQMSTWKGANVTHLQQWSFTVCCLWETAKRSSKACYYTTHINSYLHMEIPGKLCSLYRWWWLPVLVAPILYIAWILQHSCTWAAASGHTVALAMRLSQMMWQLWNWVIDGVWSSNFNLHTYAKVIRFVLDYRISGAF